MCDIEGVSGLGSTYYPGVHRLLPAAHALRNDYQRTMVHVPRVEGERKRKRQRQAADEVKQLVPAWTYGADNAAYRMRDADVRRIYDVLRFRRERSSPFSGYKRAAALASAAPHLDMVLDVVVDPMHCIMNLGRGLRDQLSGAARIDQAVEVRRRVAGRPTSVALSHEQMRSVDDLCSAVRLSHGNGQLPRLFDDNDQRHWKAAQWVDFFSPVGVYLIACCRPPIEEQLRSVLVDVISWVWRCTAYRVAVDDVAELRRSGIEVLTRLELLSPFQSCTIARHYVAHFVDTLERHGPLSSTWM
jgi:hypothetical protein